jgi:hypothetical protein
VQNVNSIEWVGPSRHCNANIVGIVDVRTSLAKDVHRPSMDIRKKASVGSVWVSFHIAMSHELTKQFVAEVEPNTARTFSSKY